MYLFFSVCVHFVLRSKGDASTAVCGASSHSYTGVSLFLFSYRDSHYLTKSLALERDVRADLCEQFAESEQSVVGCSGGDAVCVRTPPTLFYAFVCDVLVRVFNCQD